MHMKILLFCEDFYHPRHLAEEGTRLLVKNCVTLDIIDDATNLNPAVFENYDVIILSKSDNVSKAKHKDPWKTPEVQAAFVKFVENGGGLLVVHSGIVCEYGGAEVLEELIGCRFVWHPNDCPVTVGVLKNHPVTAGVKIFTETDEHYHAEITSADADILAASFADAQGNPAEYKSEPYFNAPAHIAPCVFVRTQGKGRVCVLTPGHTEKVWKNPEFQRLLENAMKWCAG